MLRQGVAGSRVAAHVEDVLHSLDGDQLKGADVARGSGHQHGQGGGGEDEGRRLKADPQIECLLHDEHHQHRAEPGGERPGYARGQDSRLAEDAKPLHDRLRRLVQARPIARRKQAGAPVRSSQGPLPSQRQRGQEHGQNQEDDPSHQGRGGGPGRHVDEGQKQDEHQDHRQHVQHPLHDNGGERVGGAHSLGLADEVGAHQLPYAQGQQVVHGVANVHGPHQGAHTQVGAWVKEHTPANSPEVKAEEHGDGCREQEEVVGVAQGAAHLRPVETPEGEKKGAQTDQEPYPEQRTSQEPHRVSPA